MQQKVHLKHEGKIREGALVPVEESTERWTIIKLEDGTTIRMKPVVTDVVRLLGEYDDEGQPVYVVKSAHIMPLTVPIALRKDAEDMAPEIHQDMAMTVPTRTLQSDSRSAVILPIVIQGAYRGIRGDGLAKTIGIRATWAEIRPAKVAGPGPRALFAPASRIEVKSAWQDEARFQELVRKWKSGRSASSSVAEIVSHQAYQGIIGMGERAVPLILNQLRLKGSKPAHWFWALNAITLEQPVSQSDRGNLVKMSQAWLEWGRRKGYGPIEG